MKRDVLMLCGVVGVLGLHAVAAAAQEPPPVTPPPPVTEPAPAPPDSSRSSVPTLTDEDLNQRRSAIFIMEGVLINAVKLGAQNTANELRRVQPGLMMFSSAPVKAHGIYLEGYGVLFQVEIPSVIPSVASLVETLGRDALNRERLGRPGAAQPTAISGELSDAVMDPDAHYVAAVKAELINAMVRHSPSSMDLRPGELLIVSARDASEVPGQVAPPSTMTLSVRGSDLAEFRAGRLTFDQVRERITVRGY